MMMIMIIIIHTPTYTQYRTGDRLNLQVSQKLKQPTTINYFDAPCAQRLAIFPNL
jgi:hypothetical protein